MRFPYPLVALPLLLLGCRPSAQAPAEDLNALGIDPAEYARVRHYVTAQMELESQAQAKRLAPAFSRVDPFGTKVEVGKAALPQMVLFVKKGCPCSFDAQPLFNKLALKYKGKVEFVGVIDKGARDWSNQLSVIFPVVEEPSLALMKAFDARASVYSALVARNGHIVKMWPGYSADWLKDMNALLAKASATKETPFDPEYAPKEKASGCPFGS